MLADEISRAGGGPAAVAALQKDPKFAASKDKVTPINTLKAGGSVTLENEEEFDVEPTEKDIAANTSIAKLQSKYSEVVKQMKSVVNKYKILDSKTLLCNLVKEL